MVLAPLLRVKYFRESIEFIFATLGCLCKWFQTLKQAVFSVFSCSFTVFISCDKKKKKKKATKNTRIICDSELHYYQHVHHSKQSRNEMVLRVKKKKKKKIPKIFKIGDNYIRRLPLHVYTLPTESGCPQPGAIRSPASQQHDVATVRQLSVRLYSSVFKF